jgi:hypothetical protein
MQNFLLSSKYSMPKIREIEKSEKVRIWGNLQETRETYKLNTKNSFYQIQIRVLKLLRTMKMRRIHEKGSERYYNRKILKRLILKGKSGLARRK